MNAPHRYSTAFLAALCMFAQPLRADSLDAGFAQPPPTARPLVWWHWINGNVSKHGIEADLADMQRVGIGGVQMFDVSVYIPPGPVRYGSPAWHEHVRFAIETAAKHGLEFYAMNTPGWSASGGPWVTPERSMKQLVWTETAVVPDANGKVAIALRQPTAKLDFYREVAVLAVPADTAQPPRRVPLLREKTKLAEKSLVAAPLDANPVGCIARADIRDLTAQFDPKTGQLAAELPAGKWVVLRFGFTSTGAQNHPAVPEGHGLEIDKLDVDAVSFQFDQAIEPLLRDAGSHVGTTFKGILFDSFEGGMQNWTDSLPQQFTALKGYDLIPLLPALTGRVIESPTFTECVLSDFRATINELLAKNYFGTMQRRAHERGLIIYAEAQGDPLNPVICNEYVDVPMNEFWMPDMSPRSTRIQLVAATADVLGRLIVAAESFTATPENGKWMATPATLKIAGDGAWTAGINRFILHHYTHQPTDDGPGFALGRYGTPFGRLNTWWPLAGAWVEYVSRSQFLLQQGRPVTDVCFLQNEDHGYSYPAKMTEVPVGYDFGICYPRHLVQLTWANHLFSLPSGASYCLLALPENWAADLPTLRHLRTLARAGAPIIGHAPVSPAGLRDYEGRDEFAALVAELWAPQDPAHALIRPVPLAEALPGASIAPDVIWPASNPARDFRFRHRRTADADIYFVFNHSAEPVAGEVSFRINGRVPELWDAVAGTQGDAPVYRSAGDATVVPLQLEPYGSTFVVFRRPRPARWIASTLPAALETSANRLLAPIDQPVTLRDSNGQSVVIPAVAAVPATAIPGPWQVRFEAGRGAPAETVFATLTSWSDNPDAGIKFYSGLASYRTTFDVSAAALTARTVALLDLGTVADVAEVRLNGTSVRTLWQPPFRTDVTPFLKAGANTLEVRVANRWINRLIGDEGIPTDLKYQAPGTNKFTDGKLEALPAWLYDRSKIGEKKRVSFSTWKHYDATSPLVPSGLLGPVRIEWRQTIATP